MSEKSKPLVQLKSLAGQAVSFPIELPLQRLDGSTVAIVFTCQAHGKLAWSKAKQRHIDSLMAIAKDKQAEADDNDGAAPPIRVDEAVAQAISANAALVMEFVTGWSLTDDFNLTNLEDLEDRFGSTLEQLIKAYDKAVYQGQLGN